MLPHRRGPRPAPRPPPHGLPHRRGVPTVGRGEGGWTDTEGKMHIAKCRETFACDQDALGTQRMTKNPIHWWHCYCPSTYLSRQRGGGREQHYLELQPRSWPPAARRVQGLGEQLYLELQPHGRQQRGMLLLLLLQRGRVDRCAWPEGRSVKGLIAQLRRSKTTRIVFVRGPAAGKGG